MIRQFLFVIVILTGLSYSSNAHKDTIHSKKLEFVENKNQWQENILYKADLSGGALFLEKNCYTFAFTDPNDLQAIRHYKYASWEEKKSLLIPKIIHKSAYKVLFQNPNIDVVVTGLEPKNDYNNYFVGRDKSKWASRVKKFEKVKYKNLWNNIDIEIYEKGLLLKYDIIVLPGADIKDVAYEYDGVENISINQGNIVIKTSVNKIVELKPFAYQIDGTKKIRVACKYKLKKNIVTYAFPEGYDTKQKLVIDPVLVFSSYSGSTTDNWGYTATYDDEGYLYAGGCAFSNGYPLVLGAYQNVYGGGGSGITISKYDTTGSYLIYSTYLGGSGSELPSSLIVNNANELFVLGSTGSNDFPVAGNAYDTSFNGGTNTTVTAYHVFGNGSDIIVSRFSADGTSLVASTYIGGNGNDGLNMGAPLKHNYADEVRGEIIIDANNNVYIVSSTHSTNFPTSAGAFQPVFGGGSQDGCIFKMDNDLTTMIWGSYIGGNDKDAVYSVVLDKKNHIYVSGGTVSANFPTTPGVLHPYYIGGVCNGFITKIKETGTNILYSTFYGATHYDQVYFVDRDKNGNIYVLGQVDSAGTSMISNATWSTPDGGQFISKISNSLDTLIWSTTWGTGSARKDVSPTAFMVDMCNNIYLSAWGGTTNSSGSTTGLPVTLNAFQNTTDGSDYYFMVINSNASNLIYATFFGGTTSAEHVDGGTSRFDSRGIIYQSVCAGCGGHSDFPTTPGAWSVTNGSTNCNNGVIKFDFNLPLVIADFVSPPVSCAPCTISFNNTSTTTSNPGVQCYWDFGDGNSSTQCNPTHVYSQSGVYDVILVVTDTGSCNYSDTITKQFIVLSNSSSSLAPEHLCLGESIQIGILPYPDPNITYFWTPSTGLTSTIVSNPYASPPFTTNYTIYVSNGICTDTISQTVIVYDMQVDAGNDTTVCISSVTLTGSSGVDSAEYIWSSNSNFTDTLNSPLSNNSVLVTITTPQWFYLVARKLHCFGIDSVYVDVQVITTPGVVTNPSCSGYSDGSAQVIVSVGTQPYHYSWSNGGSGNTISNLSAGTYTCTVTDADSCVSITNITLTDPLPLVSNPVITDIPCEEVCIGAIDANVTGSNPPYNYNWSSGQITNPVTNLCAGTYIYTVTDTKLCELVDTVTVVINSPFLTADAWADEYTIYSGLSVGLHATNIPNCTYIWTPVSTLSNPSIPDPVATPLTTTTYYVLIEDQYGCTFLDSVTIYVIMVYCDEPYIFVPNGFTPNGDNVNDKVFVRGNNIQELYFAIYDRWGEKVFETTNQNLGWDGTYKGKKCSPGVFAYYLDIICVNEYVYQKKGNITIIR